jgi:hypothetical protein
LAQENKALITKAESLERKIGKLEEVNEDKENKAKNLCEEIKKAKHFSFHEKRKYAFTVEQVTERYNFRATAIEGYWDIDVDKSCKSSGAEQQLIGDNISVHLIEVLKDGRFQPIGHAIAKYDSTLQILSSGEFGDRKIKNSQSMSFEYLEGIQESKQLKDKICGDYNPYRQAVHSLKESFRGIKIDSSQPCIPTMGQRNGKTVFAFICNYYTRVMEEDAEQDQRRQNLTAFTTSNYCSEYK